jgi:superfamily I DNA/RNA helicase
LLCCYNRLLGTWLTGELAGAGPLVTSGTLHSIMLAITGSAVPENAGHHFWSRELPGAACDALLSGHEYSAGFDAVILDEAQDLATEPYLDVLDLLVKGGLAAGRVLAFGDFAHQAIYTGIDGRELLRRRVPSTSFLLKTNCRNRPRIGHLAGSAFGNSPYTRFRRPDDGIPVTLRKYANAREQAELLASLIDMLRDEGHQLGDIALLSLTSTSIWQELGDPHSGWIAPAASRRAARIQASTVHAFKGLEASAVIVADVANVDSLHGRQLLYIAASRATDRLAVLVDDRAAPALAELIIGGTA